VRLITVEKAFKALVPQYRREDQDDVDLITFIIECCSSAVEDYAKRPIGLAYREAIFSMYGNDFVHVGFPVALVTSARYSATRDFANAEEIETNIVGDKVFFTRAYRGRNVLKMMLYGGYAVPRFYILAENITPDSRGAAFPAAPNDGDIFQNTESWIYYRYETDTWVAHPEYAELEEGDLARVNGALFSWDGVSWQNIEPVPDLPMSLSLAVIEYVIYEARRIRQNSVGITKLERGYSFEGAAIGTEERMPRHVRDLIDEHFGGIIV